MLAVLLAPMHALVAALYVTPSGLMAGLCNGRKRGFRTRGRQHRKRSRPARRRGVAPHVREVKPAGSAGPFSHALTAAL